MRTTNSNAYTLATVSATRTWTSCWPATTAAPKGIWSDGTTMWVSDDVAGKLIAYNLKDDTNTNENGFGNPDTDMTSP